MFRGDAPQLSRSDTRLTRSTIPPGRRRAGWPGVDAVLAALDHLATSVTRMSPIIQAQELSRWYGIVMGLNNVSFEIEPGLTGLVGPNGAGKSTLIQIITGQLKPSSGQLTVFGETALEQPPAAAAHGLLPGRRGRAQGPAAHGLAARAGAALRRAAAGGGGPRRERYWTWSSCPARIGASAWASTPRA